MAGWCTYITAYLMWATTGFLGWHHLYLQRYAQALVYGQTFGLFGLGWLLDLFYVHVYVREASVVVPPPASSWLGAAITTVLVGILGYLYGAVAELMWTCVGDTRSIEDMNHRTAAYGLVCLCVCTGAQLAAAWRRWDVRFLYGLGGACLWLAIVEARASALAKDDLSTSDDAQERFSVSFLAATAVALTHACFRKVPKPTAAAPVAPPASTNGTSASKPAAAALPPTPQPSRPVGCCYKASRVAGVLSAQGFTVVVLLAAAWLHSETPVDENGKQSPTGLRTVKLGAYIYNNADDLRAQAAEMFTVLRQYYEQRGWEGIREDLARELFKDDSGDYAILGVQPDADLATIKSAHRRMARKFHPDTLAASATQEERAAAAEKFRKVQSAYERLSAKLSDRPRGDADAPEEPQQPRRRRRN